jgi:hypothetical protein
MSYLYGDSTPSKLEVNYIEFLRDAVEFSVQVLLADQRIAQGRAQTRTLEHTTVTEVERLQKLGPLVAKAFEGAALGAPDLPTARCAAAILRSANDLVRVEAIRMRDALDAEIGKRDAQATQERDGCVKALEALVVRHDLPGTVVDLHLTVTGGARYAGRARMKTGFGLEAVLDLEIPGNNLFDRVVRVDRLLERLDVQAPEIGGWLHKEVKRRPQHLEKHHISEFSIGSNGGALIKLRLAPDGTGPGFDVLIAREAPRVRLVRADQQEGAAEQPFEVDDDDAKKLLALHHKLAVAAAELSGHRRRLVEAKIDGEAMRTHAKPALLVERLIGTMAPVVQEIAARSQSPGELVLRRLLSGDRREEIFLSKIELKLKLEPLGDANRALFEPLWASTMPVAPAAKPAAAETPPHAQTMRYRPATPPLGMPPVNVSAPVNVSTPVTVSTMPTPITLSTPPPNASRPASESTAGDPLRRTLIGTTVQSAAAAAAAAAPAAVPVAVPADKTPRPAVVEAPKPQGIESPPRQAAGTIGGPKDAKTADPVHRS